MKLSRRIGREAFGFLFLNIPLLGMFWLAHSARTSPGGPWDPIINLGLFLAFAAPHSLLARDFGRRLLASIVGEARVRRAYEVVAGVTLGALVWWWRPLPGVLWHFGGAGYWLLNLVFVLGLAGMVYTARCFDMIEVLGLRNASAVPAGTPRLSVAGPYAYCRHPLYVGFFIALWATPAMTFGQLEFAVLCTAYLLIGSSLEERNLLADLGSEYELYCRNVPMWFPRLKPWRGSDGAVSPEGATPECDLG